MRRKLLSWLGWLLAPGYGSCARCRIPWKYVRERVIMIDSGRVFCLCNLCFKECTADEAFKYFASDNERFWHYSSSTMLDIYLKIKNIKGDYAEAEGMPKLPT